jgi:hypothetical protein
MLCTKPTRFAGVLPAYENSEDSITRHFILWRRTQGHFYGGIGDHQPIHIGIVGETSSDYHRRNGSETGRCELGSTYRRKHLGTERRGGNWRSYPVAGVEDVSSNKVQNSLLIPKYVHFSCVCGSEHRFP